MDHFEDIGPSVVMASPGMMQSGLSRELFESWCMDKRNGVIIAGYCVEGTLAKVGLGVIVSLESSSRATVSRVHWLR
jgi:Cft2 family RNA processing exonuclease